MIVRSILNTWGYGPISIESVTKKRLIKMSEFPPSIYFLEEKYTKTFRDFDGLAEYQSEENFIFLDEDGNVTSMKFECRDVNLNGTSFVGRFHASVKELSLAFGPPSKPIDDTASMEWSFVDSVGFAWVLYDYKSDVPLVGPFAWHIGCQTKQSKY